MLQIGRISKIVFCEISHFTDFPNILALSPCKKTLELLEVIHETVTLTKVLRKKCSHRYLQENVLCLIYESWFLVLRRGLRNFKST